MTHSGTPIIPQLFTADPTALASNNRIYLYTRHDEAPVGTIRLIIMSSEGVTI